MKRITKTMLKRHRIIEAFIIFISLCILGAGMLLLWASSLKTPDLSTFDERRVAQSTKIYDRTGEVLLYDIHQETQRTIIPFEQIAQSAKDATVAIEDEDFYQHYGIKPTAIIRAILVNIGAGSYEQGGSTITQQVVKNSLLTTEKTITRKLKEWILALKIERVLSKEAILELYLNEVPYGGSIYGIQEAAITFFDKSASDLTVAEAAYLAAIPQAPTYYSPYGNHKEELEKRKNTIIRKMAEQGVIDEATRDAALAEQVVFQPRSQYGIKAPHFVFFVREYLEEKYGKEFVERGGIKVITTLDWYLQEKGETIVRDYSKDNVEKFNAHNAGLVAVDPKTGQILTMVGSRDYFDKENDGNFNVTINPNRQPGSAFKPFVYATAFMKGYRPETVVFDVRTQFGARCPYDENGIPLSPTAPAAAPLEENSDCYVPVNYDDTYRGPVSLRDALAQSINVPAVKTLYLVGLRDAISVAERMGISSLKSPETYGLTLVLGGGETSLLEMTGAYGVFGNGGVRNKPTSILRIETLDGQVLESFEPHPERVIEEDSALRISDVLSDNTARTPAFGARSALYFPDHDVASKTGTTNDYRDAWIVGYTPTIAAGAWAGNNNNSPMNKKVAGFIIAPLWNAFMQEALTYLPQEPFKHSPTEDTEGIKAIIRGGWEGGESFTIDTLSGNLATNLTPEETRKEIFLTDIHSELYWIDKNNPLGPRPESPERDDQFLLWEQPVLKWAAFQGLVVRTRDSMPSAYDTIHTEANIPKLSIDNLSSNIPYNPNTKIFITITTKGPFPLKKVDLYVNNTLIGSSERVPFVFSFTPRDLPSQGEVNTLRVIGTDIVYNKGSATTTFTVISSE